MGFFDWLRRLTSPPPPLDRGLIIREGHPLAWARTSLPIDVILAPSAADYLEEVISAALGWNSVLLRAPRAAGDPWPKTLFLRPTSICTPAMLEAFANETKRKLMKRTVLVTAGRRSFNPVKDRHIGHTDFRYDTRTGEIFNAEVILPPRPLLLQYLSQQMVYQAVLHEFGHVGGLDHDSNTPFSIMRPELDVNATQVTAPDVELLRKTYGARG